MPERDSETAETPGLVRALQVLRERWLVIALCALVSLVVAVAYVEHKPDQYTATASLQFTTNSLPSQVAGVGQRAVVGPRRRKEHQRSARHDDPSRGSRSSKRSS